VKDPKSPRPDEFCPHVMKECKFVISEPFAGIFRKYLISAEVVETYLRKGIDH